MGGLFLVADTSGDGKLTWDEFQVFFGNPLIRSYMASLQIDTQESFHLFQMLDDGEGSVTVKEFVQGVLRLKGSARSQDVVSIMHDTNRLSVAVAKISDSIARINMNQEGFSI